MADQRNPDFTQLRQVLGGGGGPAGPRGVVTTPTGQPMPTADEFRAQEKVLQDYIKRTQAGLGALTQIVDRNRGVIAALTNAGERPDCGIPADLLNALSAYLDAQCIREELAMNDARLQLNQFDAQLTQLRQMKLAYGVV